MHTQYAHQTTQKRSLFSPLVTLNPGQTDLLKLIALLSMLTDHVNTVLLHGSQPLMYAVGRMAFPLFTLVWAMHAVQHPQKLQGQATRLWLWAVGTQPVFWFTFSGVGQSWLALNILFQFAACTQALAWLTVYGTRGGLSGVTLLLLLAWPLTPASYGVPGIVFCGLTLLAFLRPSLAAGAAFSLLWILTVASLNGLDAILSWPEGWLAYALLPALCLPLLMAELASRMPSLNRRFLPGKFFYHAYAGHLLVLGVVRFLPAFVI